MIKLSAMTQLQRGWAQAFFSVLVLWGLLNVFIRYSSQVLDVHPVIFMCSAFASSSVLLILIGGHGVYIRETLKSVQTWSFGIILFLGYVLYLILFQFVTATEGTLLVRISLIFSLIVGALFFGRIPLKGQIAASVLIIMGVGLVLRDIPNESFGFVIILMTLVALTQVISIFIAELHKPHEDASRKKDFKAKARVVGFIMFVVSMLFLSMMLLLSSINYYTPLPLENSPLPDINDLMHAPSILAGSIAGLVLLAPMRMVEFASSQTIKTENYLAISALSAIATLFWESISSPITNLSIKAFVVTDYVALFLITAGALVAAISKIVKTDPLQDKLDKEIMYQPQNYMAVEDSREIVAHALEHYDEDLDQVTKKLGVSSEAIVSIVRDQDRVMAFRPETLARVARNYRKHVAQSDSLTGLLNKRALLTYLRNLPQSEHKATLFEVDLNKFKPVNDTYGHEAGDQVLQEVANRLKDLVPTKGIVTRVGGDEFCMVMPGTSKKQAAVIVEKITKKLGAPYKIKETRKAMDVGASVGYASYPEDTSNPEDLVRLADIEMYKIKHARDEDDQR